MSSNNKWLFISLLLIVSNVSLAQKCKFKEKGEDPISGEIFRKTKSKLKAPTYGVNPFCFLFFIRKGSEYQLEVHASDYGEQNRAILEGSELILKLGNDELITSLSNEKSFPETSFDLGSVVTEFKVIFNINEGTIQEIAKHGITYFRFEQLKNKLSEIEVSEKLSKKLKQNARCILEE